MTGYTPAGIRGKYQYREVKDILTKADGKELQQIEDAIMKYLRDTPGGVQTLCILNNIEGEWDDVQHALYRLRHIGMIKINKERIWRRKDSVTNEWKNGEILKCELSLQGRMSMEFPESK